MNQAKVGQFIAEKRRNANMTQAELAKKLSVSDKAVSKWERGICCPDISLLVPLSEALGTSVQSVLKGEDVSEIGLIKTEESESLIVDTLKTYSKDLKSKVKTNNLKISILVAALLIVGLFFYTQINNSKYNDSTQLTFSYLENDLQHLQIILTELEQNNAKVTVDLYVELKTLTEKAIQSSSFFNSTLIRGEPVERFSLDCESKLIELNKILINITPPFICTEDTLSKIEKINSDLNDLLFKLKKEL